MTQALMMIVLLGVVFFALILNLALQSRFRRAFMRWCMSAVLVIGLSLYGYGYAVCYGITAPAMIRALLAVCRMFAGINDLEAVKRAPLFDSQIVLTVFWIGHFLGFYVTASAAIAVLGERLLRRIRVTLLRRGSVLLIYGVHPDSLAYGRHMAREKHRAVLFIDPNGSTAFETDIKSMGAVLENSGYALNPNDRFLREIGMRPGSRKIEIAALDPEPGRNLSYARALLDEFQQAGIHPEQTRLLIAASEEASSSLLAREGRGFGSVFALNSYDLAARLISLEFPPCDRIAFDAHGRAKEDYHAVIVGFGRLGRAILEQLVMNGQFTGSRFRVDVFDAAPQNGSLFMHPILDNYDIRFHLYSGKSTEFFRFMEENREDIRCVFLSTGSGQDNAEIARDLAARFFGEGRFPALVQADLNGFVFTDEERRETVLSGIYESGVPDLEELDARAMQIHSRWIVPRPESPEKAWQECDYFGRLSTRAAADACSAMLRASGKTAEQVLAGEWPPDPETLENLAQTEHLRWCAFHHVMGYRTMEDTVWNERAERYRKAAEAGGKPAAIGKDPVHRLHACLIPWEALDALSEKENAVTGGRVDYKEMDRQNVLAVADILASQQKKAGEGRHE